MAAQTCRNAIIRLIRSSGAALVVSSFFAAGAAEASAPYCAPYQGSGYCQYTGRVVQAYINSGNQIILYFDTPMNLADPASVGISGVTVGNAASYNMSANVEFGKALYASLLAAQARGATIIVQMWGVSGGYLQIDRIWVNE